MKLIYQKGEKKNTNKKKLNILKPNKKKKLKNILFNYQYQE